ncbi:V-type ATPase 116kDa subunit family protein [Hamadaea sp. NPDC050747]|uniref:V-type ATPase 116kDa subunit family protein n=1 Tax=Hamadaea sp. NPDC050747 TaxID=3155789 RepID=UPI0033FAC37F
MSWREALAPQPMSRVAILSPMPALRAVLARVADEGVVEFDRLTGPGEAAANPTARLLRGLPAGSAEPRLAVAAPDLNALVEAGRIDLLAGEAQLAEYAGQAVVRGHVAGLVGWTPTADVTALCRRLGEIGGVAVELPLPRGTDPPTAIATGRTSQAFGPLVTTYTTVPYADVDPTLLAGLAYVVMFGAMFGDVGHGLLLALIGVAIRWGLRWPRAVTKLRPHWMFITAAGVCAALFGLGYGEFFGPTGVVPVWWISPMDHPVPLLLGGIALGVVLLGLAYALGTINRVREGGWSVALYAPSGLAGSLLFVALGLAVPAWYLPSGWLAAAAVLSALLAIGLAFVGFWTAAGRGAGGVLQAVIEVFDMVLRLGSNIVSFARLAAFGLTHAVLGWIVWDATTGLWSAGPAGAVAAVAVFVVGNAFAFALEALVAAVQALRLEYYELFSRVFQTQGRPFQPWHIPLEQVPLERSETEES